MKFKSFALAHSDWPSWHLACVRNPNATMASRLTRCYASIQIGLIAVLLFITSGVRAGETWLEGAWVSDARVTMQTNPKYRKLNKESDLYKLAFEMYGNIAWKFDSKQLEVIQKVGGHKSDYEVESQTASRLKITISREESWRIEKVPTGFCATLLESGGENREDLQIVECFKPVDT